MWVLNFLPDAVFQWLFAAGVVGLICGFFLGFIPFVGRYKLPIQVISMLAFTVGLWYLGGIAKDREWKARVAELEVKLAEAKAQSAVVNTEVVTKVITKKQVIKEKGDTITEYVKGDIQIIQAPCEVPESAVKAHNAAALNRPEILEKSVDKLPANTEVKVDAINEAAKSGVRLAPKK